MTRVQPGCWELVDLRDPRSAPPQAQTQNHTSVLWVSSERWRVSSLPHSWPRVCSHGICVRPESPRVAWGDSHTEGLPHLCFPQGEPGAAGIPGDPVRCPYSHRDALSRAAPVLLWWPLTL